MEKVILRRLQWIAAPPHTRSMGFKRASGTRDAVSTLIHDLTECRARKRNKCAAIFLDLKQALKLVGRKVVLNGLVDAAMVWRHVLDFQSGRSSEMEFENGTPQGSTLSPCFFNYAMNTFLTLNQPQRVKIIAYADDIVLYCDSHTNPVSQLQKSLDLMTAAAARAGFLFAPAKTQAMWFLGKKMTDTKLHLDATDIEWVKQFNYLGVVIDCKLRFHTHAEYITARVSKAANALKILGQLSGLNCFTLRRIFKSCHRLWS